ncbi:TIGR04282 family arsenosugar biosynthesis glycosyltransferase [Sulfitobacter sp. F26169L]|uniref:TIGR04282 family arsenosugar biosynthesis glycosyltransferase n=1 Tax=Sulfitobacter sp. F26169L TaxID=2996015 RepID=UPI002260ABCD|nr:TIGR04282 family arsenosugar biosynthesis glycosyltransferase [Sulfitobacter sp. F26169L]MCX7565812.1 TIGR04282 family arsenosugar biosynthesis glycosyltransferase [Sulfitobacter sp. F26169L]
MRRTVVVMLKEPRVGRVKTRLGRDIGMVAAAWWFRHQVRALLRRISDPRWNVVLAVSPDCAGMVSRVWPTHLPRIPQGSGNLGDRMARALRSAPVGPVCVIGGDIPDINAARIQEAFVALGRSDAVFGPATDGGYWLIGLSRVRAIPPVIFSGVRWSSQHALADTIATLPDHRIAYVACLRDVDTADDLN